VTQQARYIQPKVKVNETRTWGIEIECIVPTHTARYVARKLSEALYQPVRFEGYNHHDGPQWKVVTDASLHDQRGIEVVSPALKGKAGLKELWTVCEVLRKVGARITRHCGLHVHHDAWDLGLDGWKSLFKLAAKFEETVDDLVAPSRRGAECRWAQSFKHESYSNTCHWGDVKMAHEFKRIDECRTLRQVTEVYQTRYTKVNGYSYWRHGTVEFRQHAGTVEFEKMVMWIHLTQRFVETAAERKPVVQPRVKMRLDYLFSDVKVHRAARPWFVERAAAFAAAA
jgi:hypothetical protein